MIADFSNLQCYRTTNTNINIVAYWTRLYGDPVTYGSCSPVGAITNMDDGSGGDSQFTVECREYSRTYTCPASHPTKLNNSICEYRENF